MLTVGEDRINEVALRKLISELHGASSPKHQLQLRSLMFQQPHRPRGHDHSADKQSKAIGAVAHHIAGVVALGNAEYRGCTKSEDHGGAEVREFEGHGFLPIAMW